MAIIGISGNILLPDNRKVYNDKPLHMVEMSLVEIVENFGHTVIILPVHNNFERNIENLVNLVDGIILSGGTDVSCELYNEELINPNWAGQINRDKFEIALLEKAKKMNKPVLGVCRGCQLMNVAYGGSLYQDIVTLRQGSHIHRDQGMYDTLGHTATILKESKLYDLFQKEEIYINSVHHQGIKELGEGLEIMAYSDDGLIEAIRDPKEDFVWGVQWHPEWMNGNKEQEKLFQKFFSAI